MLSSISSVFFSFSLFFSFSYSHNVYATSFVIFSQFLDILSHFFLSFIYLCILIWEISIDVCSKLTGSFLGYIPSTDDPSKAFFISFAVFWIYHISFRFFPLVFSLLTLPICSCMLSSLFTRALNLLIIVISNSWCDNSKTFNSCFVFSYSAFFFF